jgi:hypothetical protein
VLRDDLTVSVVAEERRKKASFSVLLDGGMVEV